MTDIFRCLHFSLFLNLNPSAGWGGFTHPFGWHRFGTLVTELRDPYSRRPWYWVSWKMMFFWVKHPMFGESFCDTRNRQCWIHRRHSCYDCICLDIIPVWQSVTWSCWKSVLNFGDTSGKVILFQLKHLVFQADMQILLQLTRGIVICEPLPNCSGSRQPKLPSCTLTLQVFMRSVLGPRIIIRITSFLGEISCDQIASGKPENPWRLVWTCYFHQGKSLELTRVMPPPTIPFGVFAWFYEKSTSRISQADIDYLLCTLERRRFGLWQGQGHGLD